MQLTVASWNVLADAYIRYGDYTHVPTELLGAGARIPHVLAALSKIDADVIGLQEVDEQLLAALRQANEWEVLWSPKKGNKPDGCATLIRPNIPVQGWSTLGYLDGSGHIAQLVMIGGTCITNTHLKWAPAGTADHPGVAQLRQLLEQLAYCSKSMVLADSNDLPGGPLRTMLRDSGFVGVDDETPTAKVDGRLVALDIAATRGVSVMPVDLGIWADITMSTVCPSDHIPIAASITW